MICRALRILLPVHPAELGERPDGEGCPSGRPSPSEHQRLTAGTADMWRELVHLCWETPT